MPTKAIFNAGFSCKLNIYTNNKIFVKLKVKCNKIPH